NPAPCTLNPNPQILNPKPETRNPKPETRNHKPVMKSTLECGVGDTSMVLYLSRKRRSKTRFFKSIPLQMCHLIIFSAHKLTYLKGN
ncbi:hypothetical protein T484DRAFT_1633109, partial [Baffinella frigidus]